MVSKMALSLHLIAEKLLAKYKELITNHAEDISDLEGYFKLFTYFVTWRYQNSPVLAELLYMFPKIFTFFNDFIRRHLPVTSAEGITNSQRTTLQHCLTVISYAEVFLEVAVRSIFGSLGQWIVITAIQLLKCCLRFILLWNHNVGLQPYPLEEGDELGTVRSSVNLRQKNTMDGEKTKSLYRNDHAEYVILSSPYKPATHLSRQRLYAESLYICKPIIHLLSVLQYSSKTWHSWLVAFIIDIISLCGMGDPSNLGVREKQVLRKRSQTLLLYLLRSPFYDRFTRRRIASLLAPVKATIPASELLTDILEDCVNYYRDKYFYMWSS